MAVCQGCVISPDLINLYSEMIMREIKELEGIRLNGYNINNIRYADDTVLVADSEKKLQGLLNVLNEVSERKGLKINKSKTEVMQNLIKKSWCKFKKNLFFFAGVVVTLHE